MEINQEELIADAAAQNEIQAKKLSLDEIIKLANLLKEKEEQIAAIEEQINSLKKEWRELGEKTLPEAMQSLGLNNLGLEDGSSINLQDIISASINDENREAAHDWLRKNGHGDIIKNEVVIQFGKEEDEKASYLYEELQARKMQVLQQEKVHPSTLKAFVKERIKNGEELPADIFKLFVGVAARVNKGKGK